MPTVSNPLLGGEMLVADPGTIIDTGVTIDADYVQELASCFDTFFERPYGGRGNLDRDREFLINADAPFPLAFEGLARVLDQQNPFAQNPVALARFRRFSRRLYSTPQPHLDNTADYRYVAVIAAGEGAGIALRDDYRDDEPSSIIPLSTGQVIAVNNNLPRMERQAHCATFKVDDLDLFIYGRLAYPDRSKPTVN